MPARRIMGFFLLMALSASPAFADGAVGIYGGLNFGSLSGDAPANSSYSGNTGMVLGAFGEIRIADDVLLGLHPAYLQKGSTISIASGSEDVDPVENDLRLNYLSLPLLVKIESGNGVTYFSGGFDFSFLLDSSLATPDEEIDTGSLFENFDLSMDFAFGGKIRLGDPILTLELRYSQSLLNVADIPVEGGDYSLSARLRSGGFQFLTGLLFPLGAK